MSGFAATDQDPIDEQLSTMDSQPGISGGEEDLRVGEDVRQLHWPPLTPEVLPSHSQTVNDVPVEYT